MKAIGSAVVSLSLTMAGCAANDGAGAAGGGAAVEGRMLHAPETFTGSATGGITQDGSIALLSDRGARCDGPYRQATEDDAAEVGSDKTPNGIATLTCDDGRAGTIMFTLGADQATGTGMLGQDILTLRIIE